MYSTQPLSKLVGFKITELLTASKHCWFRQALTFTKDGGRTFSKLPFSAQASSAYKEKPVLRRKGRQEGWYVKSAITLRL